MPLKKGDIVGLYRVEESLGVGGMGEVYRAWDPRLHRQVALKVLPRQAPKSSAVKRFAIEAKAVAALSHPNILILHDVGAHGNLHYAVTELLEGETVRQRLVRGRLPWPEAVRIAAAVTDGLAAAHAKGVVHRDLKPDNIFLTWDGRVKILDFGLAFFDIRLNPAAPASRPTPPGTVIGTSGYMSPEQFLGEEVDHRSDIFALGCLVYEMISGQKAFPSKSIGEAVMALLEKEPPPLTQLTADIPAEIDGIVARCLAKAPDGRYHLAAAAGAALRRLDPEPGNESPHATSEEEKHSAVRSIAVLPFVHRGLQSETDHLSDGMSESIIRSLSRLRELRVIAWGTTERYKESPLPPGEIGRALAVDAVLTGRVLEHEGRLIVTVELASSRDGEHLWGEKYDRRFHDIFVVQDEIADQITDHLQRTVGDAPAPQRERKTENTEAYRLYLRGRYFWNKRTKDHLERSRACFEKALAADSGFALAHAGLSDTYNVMPFWGMSAPREVFPRAKMAAQRAIEIDPWLAEARASLAYVSFYFDWNWSEASSGFRKALELHPNYATARQWFGVCAALRGDFKAALEHLEQAQLIDPLSLMITADRALVWYLSEEPEQSLEQCRAAQELDNGFGPAYLYEGLALEQLEQFDDAIEALERAADLTENAPPVVAALVHCLAVAGQRNEAERLLGNLLKIAASRYVSPYPLAVAYWGLDQLDEAFSWLERAAYDKSEMMTWLETDPRLAHLRSEPRARPLLARMQG